jgi:hypothetical protein
MKYIKSVKEEAQGNTMKTVKQHGIWGKGEEVQWRRGYIELRTMHIQV